MLIMQNRKEEAQKHGRYAKTSRLKSICIDLLIIHLEISIQKISLVLSCESHPKCKLKATDNCIKRTMRKVNHPCTRKYKHRCFIPGGNITSPSLIFLSLKLDIKGLNPQSSITLPLGVARKLLGQSKILQRRTCKNLLKNKI